MTTITIKGWLVINPEQIDRVTQREPQLKPHERAMFLELEVPLAVFARPTLSAKLKLEPGTPLLGAALIDVTPEPDHG